MKSNDTPKRRFALPAFNPVDKALLGVLALLIAVLVALSILQRCGLSLINGTVMLYLPFVALFVLLGWGGYALVRRIKRSGVKVAVCSVLVLVLLLAMLWVFTNIASLAFFVTPKRYTTITSPSGARKLVVLRVFDGDEDLIEARKAARLEADPAGSDELLPEDLCQLYAAYPQVMGLFYRNDADVEGELRLAYMDQSARVVSTEDEATTGGPTHGTLMVEWLDDEATAHFFVENPGVSEGGDFYVRF